MNPSDITSMYRYDGPSYPKAVYIPSGPFQKFKAAFQDPLFLGLGGAAILLGTSALVVVNQRRISNAYKAFTRKFTKYYRRMMHGAPVLTTDHIKPIVFPQSTVSVEELQDSDAETEAIEEKPAVEQEEKPVAEEEKPKVCTNDEKAVCMNDCSSCPNSGDIEDIKRTTCKPSGACDCSYPVKNAQLKSIPVDLTDGKNKYICRCGASKNFPYCDGAHNDLNKKQGTSISPLKVNLETAGNDVVYVCACGHAAGRPDKPYCDGTHKRVHDLEPDVAAEPEVVAEVAAETTEDSTVHVEAADAEESTIEESFIEAEAAIEEAETVFEEAEEAVAEAIEETEEVIAEAIKEVAAETVEEVAAEAVEETVEEVAAEAVEEVAAEAVEEIVAEAVEEAVEEVAAEAVEEVVAEAVEEAVEETVEAVEEVAAEAVEEVAAEAVEEVADEIAEAAVEADAAIEAVEEAPIAEESAKIDA